MAGTELANYAAVASAIIAAIAAAISLYQANVFRKQVETDTQTKKIEAAISMSPYLSSGYQVASAAMTAKFGPLRMNDEPPSFEELRSAFSDKELYSHWLTMLNHWGRLAVAYDCEIIDRHVAKQTLQYGFLTFMKFFAAYFDKTMSREHYAKTIALREEWSNKND